MSFELLSKICRTSNFFNKIFELMKFVPKSSFSCMIYVSQCFLQNNPSTIKKTFFFNSSKNLKKSSIKYQSFLPWRGLTFLGREKYKFSQVILNFFYTFYVLKSFHQDYSILYTVKLGYNVQLRTG